MKRKVFMMIFIVILMMALFGITASAAYYEPDGTHSTEYEVSSEEANRTFVVKCVDESGTLLKQVTYMSVQHFGAMWMKTSEKPGAFASMWHGSIKRYPSLRTFISHSF